MARTPSARRGLAVSQYGPSAMSLYTFSAVETPGYKPGGWLCSLRCTLTAAENSRTTFVSRGLTPATAIHGEARANGLGGAAKDLGRPHLPEGKSEDSPPLPAARPAAERRWASMPRRLIFW